MGYYYETATTGVPEVDAIGAAVDHAGKSYHHTEQWTEQDANGRCVVDDIDDALRACAATIAALRSQLAEMTQECMEQARLNGMGSEREAKLLAQLDEARRERDAARTVVAWANNSLYGSNSYFVGPLGEHHIDGAVEELKSECHDLRTRAERAERVVEAARLWLATNDAFFAVSIESRSFGSDLDKATSEYGQAVRNLTAEIRALDAAEGT